MRKVINAQKTSRQLPSVKTRFVVGERIKPEITCPRLQYLSSHAVEFGKTLVFSDFVERGIGTLDLLKAIHESGVDFDFAALSVAFNPDDPNYYLKDKSIISCLFISNTIRTRSTSRY